MCKRELYLLFETKKGEKENAISYLKLKLLTAGHVEELLLEDKKPCCFPAWELTNVLYRTSLYSGPKYLANLLFFFS